MVCAAIEVDRLPGDEAAILTDQEQARRGNLVDIPLPAERDAGGVRQATLIPLRMVSLLTPRSRASRATVSASC
jgi:hypothetical protein